jgi:glucose/arabinose dehydrogenase
MVLGDKGTLFVGSRGSGSVWAVSDFDGDQRADRVRAIDRNLTLPTGVAFHNGALYVGAVNRILRYDDIEDRLDRPPAPVVVTDTLPDRTWHGSRYLRFGPDGRLYIPVGMPCNVCDLPGFGQIRRLDVRTGEMDVFAVGVRNSVGLAFHPDNGVLWFTDNGRDRMGDDIPADELNYAPRAGMHFGMPYCHQGDLPDPKYGKGKDCSDYTPPAAKLDAHGAALGLAFYTGDMFPPAYKDRLFIAQHGSWNRSEKIGYRVLALAVKPNGTVLEQKAFAAGWLQGEQAWGRPNDVLVMPDGALLVSDDKAGVIYRISYR